MKPFGVKGAGLGLRFPHVESILEERPEVPWFEILTDNYFGPNGEALKELEKVREFYPITMHSVGMSIGSTDELDLEYLQRIRELISRYEPEWVSEHLCWTSAHGVHFHDLLPLPYTEETILHVVDRIHTIQDFLGRELLLENVSSYLCFKQSEMSEWDFLNEIARRSGCKLLLDVNNIYVTEVNHGVSGEEYVRGVKAEYVKEMHLAGGEMREGYLLDTHSCKVSEEVWSLYCKALKWVGDTPTLIEWDYDIPSFEVLEKERIKASDYLTGKVRL